MEPGSPIEEASHHVLLRLLRERPPEAGHHWHVIRQAMTEVTAGYTPEGESLLRELIASDREIPLCAVSPVPHAMSPLDALKSQAIQALGRWNKIRRRDLTDLHAQAPPAALLAVAKAQPVVDGPSKG